MATATGGPDWRAAKRHASSRWNAPSAKTFVPGVPPFVPPVNDPAVLDAICGECRRALFCVFLHSEPLSGPTAPTHSACELGTWNEGVMAQQQRPPAPKESLPTRFLAGLVPVRRSLRFASTHSAMFSGSYSCVCV